ncbi:MAG TPA: DNA mismatch repair endonuclease MutL [Rectinemataceae bacterium]
MARIRILSPETSRLIAAGEVVERPASALRELIDNAVDAGAREIRVKIEAGGIDLVQVTDDGSGMSREDIELSVLEHATSKIETADDLLRARTLGFRGEALASIAAVSKLELVSGEDGARGGWSLTKEYGGESRLSPVGARKGTSASARDFFRNFPARRQFLKRPAAESALCRAVFNEKAAALPGISFHWSSGSRLEAFPAAGRKERLSALYPDLPSRALRDMAGHADGCGFEFVYADPSCHRPDRRFLQVFVNRRKVPEWGLSGILEYAFSDYLPGGMRPYAFLFIEVDPSRADFNIHPAKREVRIKGLEDIKRELLEGIKLRLREELGSGPTDLAFGTSGSSGAEISLDWAREGEDSSSFSASPRSYGRFDPGPWIEASGAEPRPAGDSAESPPGHTHQAQESFRYLGRAFGPFILFEANETLYILDQHAAHERILFDRLSSGENPSQSLLVQAVLEIPGAEAEKRIRDSLPALERMGFTLKLDGETLLVDAVPAFLGEAALPAIRDALSEDFGRESPGMDMMATMACRAAIKDGDILDPAAAKDLIGKALRLPMPRCPHGRPIWLKLDRGVLYRMVGRTVE